MFESVVCESLNLRLRTINDFARVGIGGGDNHVDLILDCVLERLLFGQRLGRGCFACSDRLIVVIKSLAVSFDRDKLGGGLELLVGVLNIPSLLAAAILIQLRALLHLGILLRLHFNQI